jgi:hypothetical protein
LATAWAAILHIFYPKMKMSKVDCND